MLILIDNYDSFTYNLVNYFEQLNQKILVFRNDAIEVDQISKYKPKYIVISPGPCDPDQAGISLEVVKKYMNKIPILGVCLGHQTIAQVLGAKIIKAPSPEHGKIHKVLHNEIGIYKNIPNPIMVTRYHSLIVDKTTMPDELIINGTTEDDLIMSFSSKNNMIHGVQYHPESICTEYGINILKNFLELIHE